MAKTAAPDIARFKANKGRVTDYYENSADTIHKKLTVLATAKIFEEMMWLLTEIRRLGAEAPIEDAERFVKIERFVTRVCEEQEGAIRTGQFVKVRADIFAAWRFLVRTFEGVLKYVLDVEDRFALGVRMPAEAQERIEIDLEEGIDDPDDESPPPKKPERRSRPGTRNVEPHRVSGLGLSNAGEDEDLPGGDPEPVAPGTKKD